MPARPHMPACPSLTSFPIFTILRSPFSAMATPGTVPFPRSKNRSISAPAASLSLGPGSDKVVCSISESRGSCSIVGLCLINFATGELILCNIADSPTYIKTIHKLLVHRPADIIVPKTFLNPSGNSKLVQVLQSNLPTDETVIHGIDRKFFNDIDGLEFINKYAFKEDLESLKLLLLSTNNFYSICCFASLIHYISVSSKKYPKFSNFRIKYQTSEHTMLIDSRTVKNLELIENLISPSSSSSSSTSLKSLSLFKILNENLNTIMGTRLLRSNILQPLTDLKTIQLRQESISELINNKILLFDCVEILKEFQDLDRLFSMLIASPSSASATSITNSDQKINNIILLKSAINSSLKLSQILSTSNISSFLLNEILKILNNDDILKILNLINNCINDDTIWSKNSLNLRNQKCYAVKKGKNGLLDISRQVYKSIIDDIDELIKNLSNEYDYELETKFDNSKGFYIRLKGSIVDLNSLPSIFINSTIKNNKFITCTTLNLLKYNSRLSDALAEIILMSDQVINELTNDIVNYISSLFKISEGIALLDMICGFANNAVTSIDSYVVPEFSDKFTIKSSRHPILEKIWKKPFISNDICSLKSTSRVQIITGTNMSGKSVYLKQVSLLVIMAQIGSLLPCDYALMPIIESLHARIAIDNPEVNSSSFSMEMTEMSYILREINNKSLIIIDELGRGSSVSDGFAISLAITESLIPINAFVFLSTHFHEMPEVLKGKPGVIQLHMETELKENEIKMQYKISKGKPNQITYGIKIASSTNLPKTIILQATEISSILKMINLKNKNQSNSKKKLKQRKLLLDLIETLNQINYMNDLNDFMLLKILKVIQHKFVTELASVT